MQDNSRWACLSIGGSILTELLLNSSTNADNLGWWKGHNINGTCDLVSWSYVQVTNSKNQSSGKTHLQ